MDEFLQRLRGFFLGGRNGEQAPVANSPFVQDTVRPVLGIGDTRITGVPGGMARLASVVAPAIKQGVDKLGGQASPVGLNSVYINPAVDARRAEELVSHEGTHAAESQGRLSPEFRRKMDEMWQAMKDRYPANPVARFLEIGVPHYAADSHEHLATAMEVAFDILRDKPGNRAYKLREAEKVLPGVAAAYNYIQQNLPQTQASR